MIGFIEKIFKNFSLHCVIVIWRIWFLFACWNKFIKAKWQFVEFFSIMWKFGLSEIYILINIHWALLEIYKNPLILKYNHSQLIFFGRYIFFHHTTCKSTCDTLSSSAANQGDNTVSVAQGGTATPGATKQLLPPDRVFKRNIYLYIHQIN